MGSPAPQNLGFETPGGAPGHAQGWDVSETPQAREHALFGALTLSGSPIYDPQLRSWTALGCTILFEGTAMPYDPGDVANNADPAVIDDDGTTGLHGALFPLTYHLLPGESYTVGVYVASGDGIAVGPAVRVTSAGYVILSASTDDGGVTFCGLAGPHPPDASVISAYSAEVTHLPASAGSGWHRVSLSFTVAPGATDPGLAAAVLYLILAGDVPGKPVYTGPRGEVRAWGYFIHRGGLSPAEGFEGAWGGNEGYLSGLSEPATATLALYPSGSPGGAPYDDFERWAPYPTSLDGAAETVAWGHVVNDRIDGGWSVPDVGDTVVVTVQDVFAVVSDWYADGLFVVWDDGLGATVTGVTAGFIDDTDFAFRRTGGSANSGDPGPANADVYAQADASAEGFEGGWGGAAYETTLPGPTAVSWGGALAAEGFEGGWGNDSWSGTVASSSSASWAADLADAAETFERVYDDADYTADPATDKLLATAQPFALNVRVLPVNVGGVPGNDFPAPLFRTLAYYVVSPNANDFKVSLTASGAAVDITAAGTGAQTMRADPRRYWPGPDINPTI